MRFKALKWQWFEELSATEAEKRKKAAALRGISPGADFFAAGREKQ